MSLLKSPSASSTAPWDVENAGTGATVIEIAVRVTAGAFILWKMSRIYIDSFILYNTVNLQERSVRTEASPSTASTTTTNMQSRNVKVQARLRLLPVPRHDQGHRKSEMG